MILACIADFYIENHIDAYTELLFIILTVPSYWYYYHTKNIKIAKISILILATLPTYTLLVTNDFRVPFFHITVPLGYFLLLSMKRSLIYVSIHQLIVISIYWWGYNYLPYRESFPALTILIAIALSSLLVVLFGIFYHIAIENSYSRLEKLNRRNSALLQEVHHRVKNNLNIISSLLGMQQVKQKNNHEIADLLQKNRNRIDTIAMVHETLYAHKDFESIELYEYLYNLSHMILDANDDHKVMLNIQENHLQLPFEKVLKIGIITNELLINSLKYAFADTHKGAIEIAFTHTGTEILYQFKDNGTQEIDILEATDHTSLGLRLIHMMTDQMDATLHTAYDHGLTYTIRIPHAA